MVWRLDLVIAEALKVRAHWRSCLPSSKRNHIDSVRWRWNMQSPESLSQQLAYLEENRDRFLSQLSELIAIPSVSTEHNHAPDVRRCAHWISEHLMELGFDSRVIPTPGHPIIYAENIANAASRSSESIRFCSALAFRTSMPTHRTNI
jgi:hypothetical protein